MYYTRKWHNWIGVILAFPMLIVFLTAIVFAFQDSFKNNINEPQINVQWLPGYTKSAIKKEFEKKSKEIFSTLYTSDSTYFYGTGYGLFSVKDNKTEFIRELSGHEIRCLVEKNGFLFIGGKQGLYRMQLSTGKLFLQLKKDIHNVIFYNESTLVVSDKKLLYNSNDFGETWKEETISDQLTLSNEHLNLINPIKTIPLHKFNMDLHTGKAFFGKTNEWIWIILVGFSSCLLVFSGIYMWIRKKMKKQKKTKNNKVDKI
jgi:hypothetical protein